MISDQNRLTEGMGSFLGGANSAVDPALIAENQFSWSENIVIRDGFPTTRPGFKFVKVLPSGVVQGLCYFTNRIKNTEDLVAMINGRLYDLFPMQPSLAPNNISPPGETDPYVSQKSTMVQANSFLVAQDGLSPAIVYDGSISYRSIDKTQPSSPTLSVAQCVMGAGNDVIAIPSLSGISLNMIVTSDANNLPDNTYVTAFDPDNFTLTLSEEPLFSAVTTLNFYAPGVIKDNISIPVGSVMAYGNGRLWVAHNNNLFAGDLVGTSSNSEIKFSETIYLNGGGSFYFNENVTGLVFLPGVDNSVGQGDLIVFTQNSIFAIKATNYDRATWQQTQGMQRKVFVGRGAVNQESIILTDRDIYFRSNEGMRSLAQATQGFKTVSFSDSLEATRVLAYDTERWLTYSPGVLFDSRYFLGGAPQVQRITDDNGNYTGRFNIVFTKLISKDFNAGSVLNTPQPAFDGEWNGLQICKLVEGTFGSQRKCFAITCDTDGKNCLYEIPLQGYVDTIKPSRTEEVQDRPIEAMVETRRFSFSTPFDIKELMRADIGFTQVYGNVEWNLKYSPDFLNSFYNIQSVDIPNEQGTAVLTTQSPPDLEPGFKNVRTVKPVSTCVGLTKRLSNFGYMFQGKLSWNGWTKLALFRLHASKKDISDLGEC